VIERLPCCPEWCDEIEKEGGAEHGSVCPESPFPITKADFVVAAEGGARAAIEDYLTWIEEGNTHEEALELALSFAQEAAVCHVGIGSCGRGWCQHN
jgi:hypothetical protein